MSIYKILKISILVGTGILAACSPDKVKTENVSDKTPQINKVSASSKNAVSLFKINTKLKKVFIKMKSKNLSIEQASAEIGIVSLGGKLLIDIGFSELNDSIISEVSKTGITPKNISKKFKRMSASFSQMSEIKELAKIPQVSIINPEYGSITH